MRWWWYRPIWLRRRRPLPRQNPFKPVDGRRVPVGIAADLTGAAADTAADLRDTVAAAIAAPVAIDHRAAGAAANNASP